MANQRRELAKRRALGVMGFYVANERKKPHYRSEREGEGGASANTLKLSDEMRGGGWWTRAGGLRAGRKKSELSFGDQCPV